VRKILILKTTIGGGIIVFQTILIVFQPLSPSPKTTPNPFNPVTKIMYDVPSNVKREKSNVKIIVYDILGREIETLVNEIQKPGSYEVNWTEAGMPAVCIFID